MSSRFTLIFSIILGFIIGSFTNMGFIVLGDLAFPWPPEVMAQLENETLTHLDMLNTTHYIFPFLAHALGTLVGAVVALRVAGQDQPIVAWIVGVLFLVGGVYMVNLLPAPLWFEMLDLLVAYLPMSYLGIMFYEKYFASEPIKN